MAALLTALTIFGFFFLTYYIAKLLFKDDTHNVPIIDFKSELAKCNQLLKNEINSNKVGQKELELYRTIKKYLDEN